MTAWRGELGDIRTGTATAAPQLTDLALTLHRLGGASRQSGVNLFEAMIEIDAHGARETLAEIDGRFGPLQAARRQRLPRRRRPRGGRRRVLHFERAKDFAFRPNALTWGRCTYFRSRRFSAIQTCQSGNIGQTGAATGVISIFHKRDSPTGEETNGYRNVGFEAHTRWSRARLVTTPQLPEFRTLLLGNADSSAKASLRSAAISRPAQQFPVDPDAARPRFTAPRTPLQPRLDGLPTGSASNVR